jgi:serine O-acetyltransferase
MREHLRGDIEADLADASVHGWRRRALVIARLVFAHRLQAVVLVRLAHAVGPRFAPAGHALKWLNTTLNGCEIAWEADIGKGLRLDHPVGVVVGPLVVIGESCALMQGVTLGDNGGSPRLGDRVAIAPGAVVMGAIEIGSDAIIGANAVVTKSVPAGAVVFGNPATVRRQTTSAHTPGGGDPAP